MYCIQKQNKQIVLSGSLFFYCSHLKLFSGGQNRTFLCVVIDMLGSEKKAKNIRGPSKKAAPPTWVR